MNLRSTPHGAVEGIVIEASTSQGLGKVCTMIVRRGTLRKGAILVAGRTWARVRTLHDEFGNPLAEAGPSMPVRVAGWRDELPSPGDLILEIATGGEAHAQQIVAYRETRLQDVKADQAYVCKILVAHAFYVHKSRLQEKIEAQREADRERYLANRQEKHAKGWRYGSTIRGIEHRKHRFTKASDEDAKPTVRLILRTDVDGTLEAIQQVLDSYADPSVDLVLVDAAVGPPIEEIVEIAAEFRCACKECFLGSARSDYFSHHLLLQYAD